MTSKPRTMTITHPDGTEQPRRRRLLDGRTVPAETVGRTWQDLVVPGPGTNGGASAEPTHPSRKHDVPPAGTTITPASEVAAAQLGQARRRARRAADRHSRKHHEVGGAAGGDAWESECSCGASFGAPSHELLREVTDLHYRAVA